MKLHKLAAGAALLLTVSAMSACSIFGGSTAGRDPSDQITSSGKVSAFNMHVGDCLISSEVAGDTFTSIPGVPCTDPHDTEVFYIFEMQPGTYDEDAITQAIQDECGREVVNYVGPDWENVSTGLAFDAFTPTKDGWPDDREIDCVVYTYGLDLTSSVKGLGMGPQ